MGTVRVVVDNRVRVAREAMPEEAVASLCEEFTYANPDRRRVHELKQAVDRLKRRRADRKQFGRAYAMLKAAEAAPETVSTFELGEEWITVPRGGMARVREVFFDHQLRYETSDERTRGDYAIDGKTVSWPEHGVELWDFQRELVDSAMRVENCLWRSPTGSGKTTAALAFIVRAGLPALVVAWSGNVFNMWVKRIEAELGLRPQSIGVLRGSKERIRPITVAMQQTLRNRIDKIEGLFGTVVCDEVDRFAAPTFYEGIDRLSARYRLGISDDERRKDKKEFYIYDLFGEVAHEVDRDEVVDRGFVHNVEVRVVMTSFDPPWYRELEGPERVAFYDRLIEEMVADKDRNATIARLAADEVRDGKRVLCLSARVAHCVQIEADVRAELDGIAGNASGLLLGGAAREAEFQRVVAGFESGHVVMAAGTYDAVKYGIDMPAISRGVACTPIASNRASVRQTCGRLCRLDRNEERAKEDAILYYLLDPCFGLSALERLSRWVRTVHVWHEGEWIAAKSFIRTMRDRGDDATE